MSFCKCKKPEIINEVHGSSLCVRCTKCGVEYWTTNPAIFEKSPYETDLTEYRVFLQPSEVSKTEFTFFVKKTLKIKLSEALNYYYQGEVIELMRGRGNKIYDLITELVKRKISYSVTPDYPHINQ